MDKILAFFILTFFVSIRQEICFAQEPSSSPQYIHQIGIGGMKFGQSYLLSASYTKNIRHNNEITFPVCFWGSDVWKMIFGGAAFNFATIKKQTHFNFYLAPELNLHVDWKNRFRSEMKQGRYGYFTCLGLIPSYKISDRIKINAELKIGHGYLFGFNDHYSWNINGKIIEFEEWEKGWMFTGSFLFRLNYYF